MLISRYFIGNKIKIFSFFWGKRCCCITAILFLVKMYFMFINLTFSMSVDTQKRFAFLNFVLKIEYLNKTKENVKFFCTNKNWLIVFAVTDFSYF